LVREHFWMILQAHSCLVSRSVTLKHFANPPLPSSGPLWYRFEVVRPVESRFWCSMISGGSCGAGGVGLARYDDGGAKGAAATPGTRYRVPIFSFSVSIVAVLFHTRALPPPALPRPLRLEWKSPKLPSQTAARPVPVPGLYDALPLPPAAPGLRAAGSNGRVWCAVGTDASLRWTGPIMSRENAVQSSREFSGKVPNWRCTQNPKRNGCKSLNGVLSQKNKNKIFGRHILF